ncbi:MAG: ubiquinone/menaquinone biosynthesis methyltransferase [Ignavibacteriae bacterium]|nr:ubiquinone/menaquinone biosynthesis methyltransferase [Ignavibacteriota bacterium]
MDKSRTRIEAMFNDIAKKYDFLNHLLTFNMDKRWRKQIAKKITKLGFKHDKILDAASGTGDLTIELLKLNPESIMSVDFSDKMLDIQREKVNDPRVTIMHGDVTKMPFENASFDLITCGFGVRNFQFLEKALEEIKRVLKPDGHFIVIENFNKRGFFVSALDKIYCGFLLPTVGNMISRSEAYEYLFKSIKDFYTVEEFTELCQKYGFSPIYKKNNLVGVVNTVYFGLK